MQCKAPEHLAWLAINHVHIFIARTVPADFESRHDIAKPLLEPILRAKYEPSNTRVQTVGADYQIEPAHAGVFEMNSNTICLLLKADDFISEDDFRCGFDLVEQQPGKIAAPERHEASAGQFMEDSRPEAGHALASGVNDPHLAQVIANALDIPCQAHALGDIVSKAPEVDDVATGAQRRCTLDHRRLEARRF